MKLIPMTMEHARLMFRWKNYAETRRFAIVSQRPIEWDAHIKWLSKNYQYFRMIVDGDDICGAVRVQDREVSIWVDRRFRGRGLAVKAIKQVSKKGFLARIVVQNIASMRSFIRAGYLPVAYQDGCFLFQLPRK